MYKLIKTKPVDILRFEQGSFVGGYWVKDASPTTVTIQANIQPMKYHEVLQMPEADRTSKWCKIFTTSMIRTKKEGEDGWDADMFEYQDDQFEIRAVKQWDMGHLDHFVGMAVRVPLAPDPEEEEV
jgi:hypothetical protein